MNITHVGKVNPSGRLYVRGFFSSLTCSVVCRVPDLRRSCCLNKFFEKFGCGQPGYVNSWCLNDYEAFCIESFEVLVSP